MARPSGCDHDRGGSNSSNVDVSASLNFEPWNFKRQKARGPNQQRFLARATSLETRPSSLGLSSSFRLSAFHHDVQLICAVLSTHKITKSSAFPLTHRFLSSGNTVNHKVRFFGPTTRCGFVSDLMGHRLESSCRATIGCNHHCPGPPVVAISYPIRFGRKKRENCAGNVRRPPP